MKISMSAWKSCPPSWNPRQRRRDSKLPSRAGIEHGYYYGDSLRRTQILINLLSNAVKFTRKAVGWSLAEEITPIRPPGVMRATGLRSDPGIPESKEEFWRICLNPYSANTERGGGHRTGAEYYQRGLVSSWMEPFPWKAKIHKGTHSGWNWNVSTGTGVTPEQGIIWTRGWWAMHRNR